MELAIDKLELTKDKSELTTDQFEFTTNKSEASAYRHVSKGGMGVISAKGQLRMPL